MKTKLAPNGDYEEPLLGKQSAFWPKQRGCLLIAVLFIAVVWTFLPAINNSFVGYDDPLYVTENAHVQQGLTWQSVAWAFSSGEAANWHPVTWMSHMLDYQLFGPQAWGHHLTNLFLHAISTVLLFLVLKRMSGALWRSFIVALFFGLHPLRVESVAWVSEKKDVLSTLFWMLTLWAYAEYTERKVQGPNTELSGEPMPGKRVTPRPYAPRSPLPAPRYYALALLFFALGLMSKPMMVSLPFVLLLLDYWPLQRLRSGIPDQGAGGRRDLLREKIPFFLLAAGISIITFLVQKSGGAIITGLSFSDRFANALVSYCGYLGKLFWPVGLAAFYPPAGHWSWQIIAGAGLFLACISFLTVILRRKQPWLLVGWFWFLGTLVPVIGLVPAGEQSMADRYSYIPCVGILLAAVWGGFEVFKVCSSAQSQVNYRSSWRFLIAAALASLLIVCGILTQKQISYWKDTETLFRHAIRVTKNNYLAHNNVGTALDKEGRQAEAIQEFQEALREKPNYAEAYNNLGVVFGEEGRLQDALNQYTKALKLKPGYADPHNNAGTILEKLGRVDEAITKYKAALRLRPDYADAHNNLGAALGRKGRLDEAIAEFHQVLRLQPKSADAHNNLGVALEARGRLDAAIGELIEAVRLKPDYARAHFNLGGALTRRGQLDAAIKEFQNALRIMPDYAAAQTNLAAVREMKKRSIEQPHETK